MSDATGSMLEEFNAFFAEPTKLNDLSGFAVAALGMRDELLARYSDVVAEHENELALRLEAEAAVERLRVCGNCDRYDWEFGEMVCTSGRYQSDQPRLGMTNSVDPEDHCHFTPSRWAARADEGSGG